MVQSEGVCFARPTSRSQALSQQSIFDARTSFRRQTRPFDATTSHQHQSTDALLSTKNLAPLRRGSSQISKVDSNSHGVEQDCSHPVLFWTDSDKPSAFPVNLDSLYIRQRKETKDRKERKKNNVLCVLLCFSCVCVLVGWCCCLIGWCCRVVVCRCVSFWSWFWLWSWCGVWCGTLRTPCVHPTRLRVYIENVTRVYWHHALMCCMFAW